MDKVTVSADALRQILNALNGPSHRILELQATRGPLIGDTNPINILIKEFNSAADKNELKEKALIARREAEKAWYAYACECDVGNERTWAFEVYDNIRVAQRETSVKPS